MADLGSTLTSADTDAWRIACSREGDIRRLAELPKITQQAVNEVSAKLELGRSRIFELVARYREAPVTSSLLDQADGFPKGRQRLKPELDKLITDQIEQFYLTRPKPNVAQLIRSIRHACHDQDLPVPARNTITARIATIERNRLIKARDGPKAAADLYRPVVQSYTADFRCRWSRWTTRLPISSSSTNIFEGHCAARC